jgi:hypothetical protein
MLRNIDRFERVSAKTVSELRVTSPSLLRLPCLRQGAAMAMPALSSIDTQGVKKRSTDPAIVRGTRYAPLALRDALA